MEIMLLGSNGMLGQALYRRLCRDGHDLCGVGRSGADYNFDLINDEELHRCVEEIRPDVIINTAAIVSVDLCEKNPGCAYTVNGRLPSVLAGICKKRGIYLVQVSTDHFYSGDGNAKHDEGSPIKFINEYGRTKYIGELMALWHDASLVLRTNIVGFRCRGGQTFVEWAIDNIRKGRKMRLYDDFYTSSIHVNDFADVFADVLKVRPTGILNLASSEVSSKKEFILELSEEIFDRLPSYDVGSVKYINGTPRGDSLGLDVCKVEKLVGYGMPGMRETIRSIAEEYRRRELS